MREKGKLAKKFTAFCFIFLVASFISTVCLQVQGQEKETKEKTNKKSEQKNNKSSSQQCDREVEEDIKPPEGEQWIAPEDEKLYKLDINPTTPKEGITGGVLIYYGHYVKPPYSVEMKFNVKNEENRRCQIFINGLIVFPSHPIEDKIAEYKNNKETKKLPPIPLDIKRKMENSRKLDDEILTKYKLLRKQFDYRTADGSKKIVEEMKMFFKNHPNISEYVVGSALKFKYKIQGDVYDPDCIANLLSVHY